MKQTQSPLLVALLVTSLSLLWLVAAQGVPARAQTAHVEAAPPVSRNGTNADATGSGDSVTGDDGAHDETPGDATNAGGDGRPDARHASTKRSPKGASDDVVLDPANDRIIARARMPRDEDAQAEVRLIRRETAAAAAGDAGTDAYPHDGAAVVQTVVYSRVLRRVVAAIRDKEAGNWPPDRAGHEDSAAYVGALEATANDAWSAFLHRADRRERYQSIVIEFVLGTTRSLVAFYVAQVRDDDGTWNVVSRARARVLDLPRNYVREDMELIAADALGIDARTAARRIDDLTRSTTAGFPEGGRGPAAGTR